MTRQDEAASNNTPEMLAKREAEAKAVAEAKAAEVRKCQGFLLMPTLENTVFHWNLMRTSFSPAVHRIFIEYS